MGLTLDINNISGLVIHTRVQHSLPFFVRFSCLEGTLDFEYSCDYMDALDGGP